MPTVDENLRNWTTSWDWSRRGEEWSLWWGDTPGFWHGAVLPRIHAMVPTGTMLEIGPGYGRWTEYLKDLCDRLVIVDLTDQCIASCRERFAQSTHLEYHTNDGRSLTMIDDAAIDFVFSFDSLVHAEPDVIGDYLTQLAGKLTADGVGFIHHSNAGTLKAPSALSRRLPRRVYRPLKRRGIAVNLTAWRDPTMTAAIFRDQCTSAGLMCITQELISWEFGGYLLDCFSFFTRPGSRWDRPLRLLRNPLFVSEARRMASVYAARSFA